MEIFEESPPPLGMVPLEGRGATPFLLVHGESLVAAASWALGAAGADLFDYGVSFDAVRESGRMLVVHDPLCPLTPVWFLQQAIEDAERTGAVVVGVRPVTDTVKEYDADRGTLGATVDRDGLLCVTSPVVLPAAVLAALGGSADNPTVDPLAGLMSEDLAGLVDTLARRFPVRHLEAPAQGRRVLGEADLAVLGQLPTSD